MGRTGSSPPGHGITKAERHHWWDRLAEAVSTLKKPESGASADFSHLDPSSGPGFYDAWRKAAQSPSHAAVDANQWSLALIRTLELDRLRQLSAAYFRSLKFRVDDTEPSSGGGIDLRLYVGEEKRPGVLVECRAWSAWKVGLKEIRDLVQRMAAESVAEGIFVTSSSFTAEGTRYAEIKGISLIDGEDLLRKILDLQPEQQRQILRMVTTRP